MIHRGNKVLDGTVADIQRQYPADEVRIRLAEGETLPTQMPGVISCEQRGSCYHLKLEHDSHPDTLLKRLVDQRKLELFELLRPSLHDIFIRIAAPLSQTV